MSKALVTVEHINQLNPVSIVDDDAVRNQFIAIYGTLWGESAAEATYEREAIHFKRLLRDNENLRNCTKASIYIAFIDLAVCGLSVEPGTRALAYLTPRGYKTGRKTAAGKDEYEQRISLTISGYGELVQRTRAGQIRHADNPVVVYEGDGFSFSDRNGSKSVDYTLNLGHNTAHPVACFMRITRADGSVDYSVMLEEDWNRLAGYSGKANKRWDDAQRRMVDVPNALYSSGEGNRIDTGFLMAKCIKHAFKTYPKVRIGKGTTYEADEQPQVEQDFYGMGDDTDNGNESSASANDTFAPSADTSAGVQVDPGANGTTNDEVF